MNTVNLKPVAGGWVAEQPNFLVMAKSIVDNEQWYTVSCRKEVSVWLRKCFGDQENQQWFQNIDEQWHINMNVFDVNEKIYTLLGLKWS